MTKAGTKLRAKLAAALEAAGPGMEWDETESEAIDVACRAADRAQELRRVLADELAGERRPTTICRVSAEIRHNESLVVSMVARLHLSPEPVKSERHKRAADARWDRHRKRNAARVRPRSPLVVVEEAES